MTKLLIWFGVFQLFNIWKLLFRADHAVLKREAAFSIQALPKSWGAVPGGQGAACGSSSCWEALVSSCAREEWNKGCTKAATLPWASCPWAWVCARNYSLKDSLFTCFCAFVWMLKRQGSWKYYFWSLFNVIKCGYLHLILGHTEENAAALWESQKNN